MLSAAVLTFLLAVAQAYYSRHDDPVVKIRKFGFDQDHTTYSHELVAPWRRPFKPGYCDSWEWHTDERYKDQRLQVCRELSGSAAHECNSPDGFCHDKCPYKNGSYPFWRIRNADTVPNLWAIKTLQFFESANARYPLSTEPTKGYASTFFGPGYYPSNAFDNNPESIWVSNGVSTPGLNWIAYEFPEPVKVASVRLVGESEHPERTPSEFFVEASCEKYFKTFALQWMAENPEHSTDRQYHKPRDGGKRYR